MLAKQVFSCPNARELKHLLKIRGRNRITDKHNNSRLFSCIYKVITTVGVGWYRKIWGFNGQK